MLIEFCTSKINNGRITEAELFYEGSITLDENIIKAANIIPGQKVTVLNLHNGNRFETYAITGKAGSGTICLNGPAARLGLVGDQVTILTYALMEPQEAKQTQLKLVKLDENNQVKN